MTDTVDKARSKASEYIKTDNDSAVFLGNPHTANLMSVVIALGGAIWADRQRMRIIETLLEKEGNVTNAMIEAYEPSEEETAAWESDRNAMVERVYAVLSRDTSQAKPFNEEYKF